MRLIKAIILLITLPAAVSAQETAADSMYIYQQSRRLVDFARQNGTQLISSPIQKLSTADISLLTANGHFRTAQTAETGMDATFGTSGITMLGRFKLFGDLRFTRTWQDSLSWSLKGIEEDVNPYYFAAIKAGAYQRINYTINALGTYRLAGDKLYLASGLNYLYNTASRSVDPRPSVQTFRLIVNPELIYKQNAHTLGLNLTWGYSHEENGVSYRNTAFNTSSLYPDRILYLMEGYTDPSRPATARLRREGSYLGTGVSYAYRDGNKYLNVKIDRLEHDEVMRRLRFRSVYYDNIGTLYLKDRALDLLAGTSTGKIKHQVVLNVKLTDGKDKNETLQASSYKYQATRAAIGYSLQMQNNSSVNFDIGLNAIYLDETKRDLGASYHFNFSYIQPALPFNFYKRYADASRLKLSLAPGLRLPLSNYLSTPPGETQTMFRDNVIYPDHSYYSSTVCVINSGAEYVTPHLFKHVYSSFTVSSNWYKPLRTGTVYPGGTFSPSGDFLTVAFGFNIYF